MYKWLFIIFAISSCTTLTTQNHCPKTKLINFKGQDNDKKALQTARKGCKKYYKNSPCLKVFITIKPNSYHAICGGIDEKSNTLGNLNY